MLFHTLSRHVRGLLLALTALVATPATASVLQCVPYARAQSGIEIRGNAGTWWHQAAGRYDRGAEPRVGAVLVLRPSRAMPIGHVAVVAEIVDDRNIYLNHANWSGPGRIERRALAQDVSPNGDWSQVRVWYAPQGSLGIRVNATFGFIYNDSPADAAPAPVFAAAPAIASGLTMADVSSTVAALGGTR